jgi:hypothetical protein
MIKVLISRKKNNPISIENNNVEGVYFENEKMVERFLETREGTLKVMTEKNTGPYHIGDVVTLNDQPCPDGKYKLGFMEYIVVENSKVKQFTMV